MDSGKSLVWLFFFFLIMLPFALSAHTSENYSISNIAAEPSTSGSSENYLIYDIGEEPFGSGEGTSENYTLWIGFPATVGVLRVPGPLNATVDSNTQNTISWDSNGNPSGVTYQLQETTPTSQSLYSGANTQYVHSSLTPNQQYCYKVRAYAGVYTLYSEQKCASALPAEPDINSSHTQNAWSTDASVDFNATSDANHFYYAWDQLADTTVTTSNTWWGGSQLTKTATSDGNWYFHLRSANVDNNLNAGGTMHYGPYNIDTNEPYTYDDADSLWQTQNVNATLTATDNASGVTATYYCIDTANSCTPTASGTSPDISCSTTCQKYLRYYSADLAGNEESVKSRLIKIDKQSPPTPDMNDEGTTSWDLVLTFTYSTDDNSGSGVSDFYLELRKDSTDGTLVYEDWTGDSDGSYDHSGAENTYTYYARAKVKDAVGHESSFTEWSDGIYVNSTAHPASSNYSVDIYTIIPSGSVSSTNYSIYDLVAGQPSVSASSDNYTAETGFAGGFIENSAPTLALNSPNSGYYGSGTVPVDFNVIDAEGDIVYLDLAYSLSSGALQNPLLNDVNLNDYANISNLNCDNNDFSSSTNCIYSWNVASVQDNNYYIDLNAWDSAGASHRVSSSGSIKVDKTAPTTTSDYNGEWSGVDINVTLSCGDGTGSGCALTQYRLDTNPSKTIEFGSWQTYTEPFTVGGDGNWAIDFNSKDSVGNIETTNREYVLINYAFSTMGLEIPAGFEIEITEDMNKTLWYKCIDIAGNVQEADSIVICLDKSPPVTSDDINSGWQGSDVNVTLSPYDAASGVSQTYYCIDTENSCAPRTDGSTGTSFTVTCDANSVCNKYVRYLSVDNSGGVEDTNSVLVRIDKSAPGTSVTFYSGWQGDLNLVFTCSDGSGSGCSKLNYRLDSGEWQEAVFTANDANVSITTDGNHQVDYYSVDNVGNGGGIEQGWQAVDKTVPSITITDPSTDLMEKSTPTISFNIGRLSGSAINQASVVVDFNGTASDDFNVYEHCTENSAGDLNCSYTELDFPEDDYNLSVYAEDAAGNARKTSRVFTLRAVIGVRNISTSGGFVTGIEEIQFEVKNTMLNDVYMVLYYSDWFNEFDNNISPTLHLDDHASIDNITCEDTDWWDWTLCTYDWNSAGVPDGNYFIDIDFWNASGGTAAAHSTMPFLVDNTPPEASVSSVSQTTVYSQRVYLSCADAGSGVKQTKWHYFSSTPSCSTTKSDYVYSTTADYLDITTDHSDYICLWCENKADLNYTAVSQQLHVETQAYVVSSIPSESQSIATQDLNNECRMYLDQNLTVSCDFKSTIKISEYGKDLNRVWSEAPELVISPQKTIRVVLESAIKDFYHKDYFIRFENEHTVTSQGEEKNYPVTVVRRRLIPMLTTEGQLEVGMLTIKIRQR